MIRVVLSLIFLLLIGVPLVGADLPLAPTSITIRQGEVVSFTLPGLDGTGSAAGQFQNQSIPFFKNDADPASLTAFIGVDFTQPIGEYPFDITVTGDKGDRLLPYRITVLSTSFGVQTLTLPEGKVDLDAKTLERVEKEARRFKDIFSQPTINKTWRLPFQIPVVGEISGHFGRRRIINGQEKSPHTGVDIAAPLGKDVLASNGGKIVLTGDFFFNGQSIVIDHGGGILTMYFHLSEIMVKEGMSVESRQIIGRVGQSGRATGPHLHWGARVHNARVDPFSLVKIGL